MPLDIAYLKTKQAPVPRGGGIVLVFTILIGILIADSGYAVIFSLLLLTAVALLCDLIDIPNLVKILVQMLAIAVTLSSMRHGLFGAWLMPDVDKCLTALLWLWVMQCFKATDRMDGFCTTHLVALGAAIIFLMAMESKFPGPMAESGLVIAGAGIGFLWWNWPPAKITMNEVGHIPLSFLVGYLLLQLIQAGYVFPALILPAYFLSDATITWVRRLYHKKSVFAQYEDYYYLRRLRRGTSARVILNYVMGLHILLACLAVFSVLEPDIAALPLALAYFAVFMLLGFFIYERN
jgi:UDP-N-acetylmuramyl pentapeptide phosphotransferase/UDP-N-acetylglucosamine-1-phosphate transferase